MSPIPCPCCRAANDTGPACRRCKADLSLLFGLEARRARLLAESRDLAAQGRFAEALNRVDGADAVRRGDDAVRHRCALLLLIRDFPAAWGWYSAAGKSAPGRGGP